VNARTLQFVFSAVSACISSAIFVMALAAAVQSGDGVSMDFSRNRGLVAAISIVFLAASVYILVRSIPERPRVVPDDPSDRVDIGLTDQEAHEPVAEPKGHDEAVLQTLEADELRLYEMIRDAGGELLQMHVVSSKTFSKAKVTRLLDKLEKRGLVRRERRGMTNRIRIIK